VINGSLFDMPQPVPVFEGKPFDGQTFSQPRDGDRLHAQLSRVRDVMRDGQWRTLASISEVVGAPEASVSARLRDLRKARHGSHTVARRYVERGLWEYRVG